MASAGKRYDAIGGGYAARRRPDPRLSSAIHAELAAASAVLNVGAGAGSYEPAAKHVVALEPSARMIAQRRPGANVVQARAEEMPFRDGQFDCAMAVLTIHHWSDKRRGLAECARVARKVIILTWDPESPAFWLVRDYFPEIAAFDRAIFPSLEQIGSVLGRISVRTLPIPADCSDGFLGAYWRRPEAYLDPAVRAAISSFSLVPDVMPGLERLKRDLTSGAWGKSNARLLQCAERDLGYRLVVTR